MSKEFYFIKRIVKRYITMSLLMALSVGALPVEAAKNKCKVDLYHSTTVKMTGDSSEGYFVKAWAVAKNADKAMAQARIDAVLAALRNGIKEDENAHGAGVTSLPPLMSPTQFDEHREDIACMLSSGELLCYVTDVCSTYPKGADNVKTPDGRKVGLSLIINYEGLRAKLQELGWIKKLNDYFEYNGN